MVSNKSLILLIKSFFVSSLILAISYLILKKYGNYKQRFGRRFIPRIQATFFISLIFFIISLLGIVLCIIRIIFSS